MDTVNTDSNRPATEAFRVEDRAVLHQGGRRFQAAPDGRSQVEFQARNTFLSHHCPEVALGEVIGGEFSKSRYQGFFGI